MSKRIDPSEISAEISARNTVQVNREGRVLLSEESLAAIRQIIKEEIDKRFTEYEQYSKNESA